MATAIKTFTKTGRSGPGMGRTSVPVTSLGYFDTATGKVFAHPRARLDLGVGGKNVRITNPAASEASLSRRTASLGMGGVGQRGRGTDF